MGLQNEKLFSAAAQTPLYTVYLCSAAYMYTLWLAPDKCVVSRCVCGYNASVVARSLGVDHS